MALQRPSLKDIISRVEGDINSSLGVGSQLKRSFIKAIAFGIGGLAHLLYGYLHYIYLQIFPDTSDSENILRHGTLNGLELKDPSNCERDLLFKGLTGKIIPAKTILTRADGLEYKLENDVILVSGQGIGHIVCETEGANGNIDIGSKVSFQSLISGVEGQAEVISSNAVNGVDQETPDELLERILDKVRQPPHGGSENDYKQWAREVSGVTRAFVDPDRMGPSTVGVTFLMDNELDIIPTEGKVAEVQAYINERRPVTSKVYVYAPESQTVNYIINISPFTDAVKTEIENEIRDLMKRESAPDKSLPLSKIREAISIAAGEDDHELIEPSMTVVPGLGKILVPGSFEFYEL